MLSAILGPMPEISVSFSRAASTNWSRSAYSLDQKFGYLRPYVKYPQGE